MWPVPSLQLTAIAAVAGLALGAGCAWYVQGKRWQADVNALRADYSQRLAEGQEKARSLQAATIKQAQEADIAISETINRLEREAADRPPRIIRLQCPESVPATRADQARDPGQPAKATTDGPGVGSDAPGGYRDLDASGLYRVTDAGKKVSAQLRTLQALCQAKPHD